MCWYVHECVCPCLEFDLLLLSECGSSYGLSNKIHLRYSLSDAWVLSNSM